MPRKDGFSPLVLYSKSPNTGLYAQPGQMSAGYYARPAPARSDKGSAMFQDHRSVLELLYKVSREFASALDLKTVLTRVLFAAINNVGGERASIVVMDDNERVVESAIVYGNQLRE